VTLKLISTATNAQFSTTTNANGEFAFLQLAPSTYSLQAEHAGFKKTTVSSVLVQVDQVTHLELTLELGSLTDSVQVEAAVPLLENDRSTLSSVVDSRTITSMPLNARQYLDLALLTPGAIPSQPGQQGGGFNMAGARSQSNLFLLDGATNMDTQINSAIGNFRITDAVQEFAVQTSVPTAEFGRGQGAQVNIVTKSGTNQFHGSAFEYFRNSDLDAADFFTNKLGGVKNTLHRNQYGASFGGPIIKDKTFFFTSWEGFRQVNPTVSSTRVPTTAERNQVTDPISILAPVLARQQHEPPWVLDQLHRERQRLYFRQYWLDQDRSEFWRERSPDRPLGRVSGHGRHSWCVARLRRDQQCACQPLWCYL